MVAYSFMVSVVEMVVSRIIERFVEKSPVAVSVRALLERVITPEKLNQLYDEAVETQYTRELLFSTVFDLMGKVVTKVFPSINAAYQDKKDEIGVSITSVYNKLNGLDISASRALVEQTGQDLQAIIKQLQGECKPWLPGFRVKMLDGNCIEATERRLKVLRNKAAGALPGKSLVVYDPALEMAINVFPCEDGHAQERSLLPEVQSVVEENDVFVMDRNFCVREFLLKIAAKKAFFICRQHQQLPYEPESDLDFVGESDTGKVYEQWIRVKDNEGTETRVRRMVLKLKKSTRDGDREISIVTNLTKNTVNAVVVCDLYRRRWSIETMFQELESHLHSEINTLSHPRAALFGFCIALVSYNILAVVKAAMRSEHGEEYIQNNVSGYYIAGELGRCYEGMAIAVGEEDWEVFQSADQQVFVSWLKEIARGMKLQRYKKHKRGPKRSQPKKEFKKDEPHVSTARLLKLAKKSP